jgi:RNA polymerase sigma-70 factor (ECF subfamily)
MGWTAQTRWRPAAPSIEEAPSLTSAVPLTATQLYDCHLTAVYRYVVRRLPRREDAEDVTAEVFQAAFARLHQCRGSAGPRAWLLGIARRKVADALRRRGRNRETLESDLPDAFADRESAADSGAGDPAKSFAREEANRTLRDLVASLNSDQREALLLQYVEGLSIAEVAEVMGKSPAAVNSLLQRARASVFRAGRGYFLGAEEAAK